MGLQHNIGLGGAAVVAMYKLGFPQQFRPYPAGKPNPAVAALSVSELSGRAAPAPAPQPSPTSSSGFSSDSVFAMLAKELPNHPDVVKRVNGVYCFNITGGPGGASKQWTVDLKNGSGAVKEGKPDKADCTVTIADADYVNLIAGKANGQQLFMSGKLKISGNMGLAMKLSELSKLNGPKAAGASGGAFNSDSVFAMLAKELPNHPDVVKRVNGVYCFNITGGPGGASKQWTVDLKNGSGAVKEGKPDKADCTVTIADADYVNLIAGKANGQQLFMSGKLKISGNMGLAMKLSELSKLNGPKAAGASGGAFNSDSVFAMLAKELPNHPDVVKRVNGVYCFNITGGPGGASKQWTVDLKNGSGAVRSTVHCLDAPPGPPVMLKQYTPFTRFTTSGWLGSSLANMAKTESELKAPPLAPAALGPFNLLSSDSFMASPMLPEIFSLPLMNSCWPLALPAIRFT